MKIQYLTILIFICLCACNDDKDTLPPMQAKGEIIYTIWGCSGDMMIIEVKNPANIGSSDVFKGFDYEFSCKNGIGVPYFDRTPVIGYEDGTHLPVGTWLHFKYREITEEDRGNNLFTIDPTRLCPAIYGPPSIKRYIVTEIIDFKIPKK